MNKEMDGENEILATKLLRCVGDYIQQEGLSGITVEIWSQDATLTMCPDGKMRKGVSLMCNITARTPSDDYEDDMDDE